MFPIDGVYDSENAHSLSVTSYKVPRNSLVVIARWYVAFHCRSIDSVFRRYIHSFNRNVVQIYPILFFFLYF